jgi:hypothetical protein
MPIPLASFPQLKLLAWNRNSDATLDEEEAFALYEREWRWVEQDQLQPQERELIARLMQQFGHGVLNV